MFFEWKRGRGAIDQTLRKIRGFVNVTNGVWWVKIVGFSVKYFLNDPKRINFPEQFTWVPLGETRN